MNLAERFPNASKSFVKLNAAHATAPTDILAHDTDTPAILERYSGASSLGKKKDKGSDSVRFLVRVTSFRVRLLDEDNLCEKYHVDCCRYAGVLPDDAPEKTSIEVSQQKVSRKEDERITIDIYRIDTGTR